VIHGDLASLLTVLGGHIYREEEGSTMAGRAHSPLSTPLREAHPGYKTGLTPLREAHPGYKTGLKPPSGRHIPGITQA